MRDRLLHHAGGQRTFIITLEAGEEVIASLKRFVETQGLDTARFSATGLCSAIDLAEDEGETTRFDELLDIASFAGIAYRGPDGLPMVTGRCSAQRRHGSSVNGALLQAHVRSSFKIVLTESPVHAGRLGSLNH